MNLSNLVIFEACRASKGCPNACLSVEESVAALEKLAVDEMLNKRLRDRVVGPVLYHHTFRIALSGCPNSCSQPQIKDISIQGQIIPQIDEDNCNGCGSCSEVCPDKAIDVSTGTAVIDRKNCLNCGLCIKECQVNGMTAGEVGFKVSIGGKLGRRPQFAQEFDPLVDKNEIVTTVANIITKYLDRAGAEERMADLVNRIDAKQLFIPGGNSN
ncbi:4Fe-4S binding protein [Metallumcola ferriviriculae]|uniref:Ferredoxin n=1 Tax=Metallumcola ferriviriculae TaxID=3039180 RepID=A0AAU0UP50_9FIRM|nr:4Fe-4S binding protein [Desulfitibacteraceae bacterium MK1]